MYRHWSWSQTVVFYYNNSFLVINSLPPTEYLLVLRKPYYALEESKLLTFTTNSLFLTDMPRGVERQWRLVKLEWTWPLYVAKIVRFSFQCPWPTFADAEVPIIIILFIILVCIRPIAPASSLNKRAWTYKMRFVSSVACIGWDDDHENGEIRDVGRYLVLNRKI